MSNITREEIERFVDRMLGHLDRLLLNRDMSAADYHAAILDLNKWEEAANERRAANGNGISNDRNPNLKP
jgi:hypothetical protein